MLHGAYLQLVNDVSSSWIAWLLQMGPTGCPETSVTNYGSTLRNMPEERISTSNLICICSNHRRHSPVEEADAVCSLPAPRYVTYWACGLRDVVQVVVGIHQEYLLRAVDADVANCAILHHSCCIVRTLQIQKQCYWIKQNTETAKYTILSGFF